MKIDFSKKTVQLEVGDKVCFGHDAEAIQETQSVVVEHCLLADDEIKAIKAAMKNTGMDNIKFDALIFLRPQKKR